MSCSDCSHVLRYAIGSYLLLVIIYVYIHRLGLYIFLGQIQHSNLSYKLTNRMCFLLRHFLPLDVVFAHIFIFFQDVFERVLEVDRESPRKNSEYRGKSPADAAVHMYGETSTICNSNFTKYSPLVQFCA